MVFTALLAILTVSSAAVGLPATTQTGLSASMIEKMRSNMETIATHSWEIGTSLETILELNFPELSVLTGNLPPPHTLKSGEADYVIQKATEIVDDIKDPSGPLMDGDGAIGDPASVGTSVLLANWTRTDASETKFSVAASNQLSYLLNDAPRTTDGAISQRVEEPQLWADFVYMAPPFIAYYGALQGGDQGSSLLEEAYNQCKLYRQYLSDESGLWKHIVLGSWSDLHHWSTGNAWAAAGMLRVLETIDRSSFSSKMTSEKTQLTMWIDEILTSTWTYQRANGTLFNYIDEDDSFADTSGTALLAAVSYRMATRTGDLTHIPAADKAFKLIQDSLTEDGWLLNTVDPLTFDTPSSAGSHSPEGQAFTLLLHSAWSDYSAKYSK
ncbi:Six-hairpin glycosidase [Daedaleopsis nitida]|nr:Six-hairpin glycosidase [Daedaleopsis nitida]